MHHLSFRPLIVLNSEVNFNKDTGEFNKLPSESGTYVFINLLYDMEDNTMTLVEYEITYSK